MGSRVGIDIILKGMKLIKMIIYSKLKETQIIFLEVTICLKSKKIYYRKYVRSLMA